MARLGNGKYYREIRFYSDPGCSWIFNRGRGRGGLELQGRGFDFVELLTLETIAIFLQLKLEMKFIFDVFLKNLTIPGGILVRRCSIPLE